MLCLRLHLSQGLHLGQLVLFIGLSLSDVGLDLLLLLLTVLRGGGESRLGAQDVRRGETKRVRTLLLLLVLVVIVQLRRLPCWVVVVAWCAILLGTGRVLLGASSESSCHAW